MKEELFKLVELGRVALKRMWWLFAALVLLFVAMSVFVAIELSPNVSVLYGLALGLGGGVISSLSLVTVMALSARKTGSFS